MKKYILVGFQNMPTQQPKFLKEFYNGTENAALGAVKGIAGFTSGNLKIQYSEGLENVMTFEKENEAGLVQQALNRSFHGRYNSWCVREVNETTTVNGLIKGYLKANIHIDRYKKALEQMA